MNKTELKQRAREIIEQLNALDCSKKPGGGVHGQVLGMEPWIIRTNGYGLQCLFDAQVLIDELLDPFDRRALSQSEAPTEQPEDDLERFEAWHLDWRKRTWRPLPSDIARGRYEMPEHWNTMSKRDMWSGWQAAKRDALTQAPQEQDAKEEIEHLDIENHRLRRGMQKLMERLASLLDEDQFADCESIVASAGVSAPQERAAVPQEVHDLISWLLGENGEFPDRPERSPLGNLPQPLYWWRTDLRQRWYALLSLAQSSEGKKP